MQPVARVEMRSRWLDLGCGAGLDSLVAAERVGPKGCVLGIDFSASMLGRRQLFGDTCRPTPNSVCASIRGQLPLRDSSVEVALVNGILISTRFAMNFCELARVGASRRSLFPVRS